MNIQGDRYMNINRSIVTTEALLHCWMNDTTDKPFVTLLKDYLKNFTRRQIPSREILE